VLVLQYSPACAAGVAIATKANVDSAAADAAILLEMGFILLSFQQVVVVLFWQPIFRAEFPIPKMHSLHPNMPNLNYDFEARSLEQDCPNWRRSI
jgi:hypothetical protein